MSQVAFSLAPVLAILFSPYAGKSEDLRKLEFSYIWFKFSTFFKVASKIVFYSSLKLDV